jgi:prevent-host-death family protein
MANQRTTSRRARPSRRSGDAGGHIAAATFKTRCLELMDRVRETGAEYVVTKHGTPVAKLVPYKHAKTGSPFGSMKDTVLEYKRPLDPTDDEYDINRR